MLDTFQVADEATGDTKDMGEEIAIRAMPQVRIKGHFLEGQEERLSIKLIKNKEVIRIFDVTAPFQIRYDDDAPLGEGKVYYRLEIASTGLLLITNPVFAAISRN